MDATQLVERYLDTWNETDPDARRAAIRAVWADDGRYVDPLADVTGPDEISNLIGKLQEQIPGHTFQLLTNGGRIDAHHDVVRFAWELVPANGGEPLAIGFDVAVKEDDGRIGSVLGFLDKAPAG